MTDKQRAWIDYYKSGHNATEAAKLAGYTPKTEKGFYEIGSRNKEKLIDHIRDRDAVLDKSRIADMQEINEFWTGVIRNEENDMKDRLKASEYRAKAAGGFIERAEISSSVSVVVDDLD